MDSRRYVKEITLWIEREELDARVDACMRETTRKRKRERKRNRAKGERRRGGVCVMSGSIHRLRQRWGKPGRGHSYLGQFPCLSRPRWERLTLVTM